MYKNVMKKLCSNSFSQLLNDAKKINEEFEKLSPEMKEFRKKESKKI
jgi:hypothetical protein